MIKISSEYPTACRAVFLSEWIQAFLHDSWIRVSIQRSNEYEQILNSIVRGVREFNLHAANLMDSSCVTSREFYEVEVAHINNPDDSIFLPQAFREESIKRRKKRRGVSSKPRSKL